MSDYQTQIETVYDQTADRVQKAWMTFVRLYTLEHPEPARPAWWRQFPVTLCIFTVIAVAGMLLSALRTAPTFLLIAEGSVGSAVATVEALLAIIVIEAFLVTVRYVLVVQRGSAEIDHTTMTWMMTGFGVAFFVALAANLYATTKDLDALHDVRPEIDLAASIIVGLAAPLLAVISGDIMGLLYLKSEAHRAQLRAEYEFLMQAWTSARDERWKADRARYGGTIRIQADSTQTLPVSTSNLPSNGTSNGSVELTALPAASTLGHRKVQQATQLAEAYFQAHPEAIDTPCEQLVPIIGVGKSTINKVQQRLRSS